MDTSPGAPARRRCHKLGCGNYGRRVPASPFSATAEVAGTAVTATKIQWRPGTKATRCSLVNPTLALRGRPASAGAGEWERLQRTGTSRHNQWPSARRRRNGYSRGRKDLAGFDSQPSAVFEDGCSAVAAGTVTRVGVEAGGVNPGGHSKPRPDKSLRSSPKSHGHCCSNQKATNLRGLERAVKETAERHLLAVTCVFDIRALVYTTRSYMYCASHKNWTSVHQLPLQNHCFIGSWGGS